MANLEEYLESAFSKWCKERDIVPIKGPAQTAKGFPDRFCQLPNGGGTIYVEFKGSSKYYDLSPMQEWWKEYLIASSPGRYFKVETKEELQTLFKVMERMIKIGPQLVEFERKCFESM